MKIFEQLKTLSSNEIIDLEVERSLKLDYQNKIL